MKKGQRNRATSYICCIAIKNYERGKCCRSAFFKLFLKMHVMFVDKGVSNVCQKNYLLKG